MRPLVYTSLSETMPELRYSVSGGFVANETPKATLNQKLSASKGAMTTTPMAMTRSTETREATLARLLGKARAAGVKLYRDTRDGRYYASSASTPGRYYLLTGYSGECAGFCQHGHFKYYAALMAALGWIDQEPDGPAPTPAACSDCAGKGTVIGTFATRRRTYQYDWQTCPTCHGHKIAA